MIKVAFVIGVIFVIILFTLYEWPKIDKSKKKDKWAYILLTTICLVLSSILIYFPEAPGPTDVVDFMFKPLEKYFEE